MQKRAQLGFVSGKGEREKQKARWDEKDEIAAEREVSGEKKGKGAAKYEAKWVEKDEGATEKSGGPTEQKGSG